MMAFIYFFACFLSGMIEMSTILWGISHGFSLIQCIGIAFGYQLGNVFLYAARKRLSKLKGLILIAAVGIAVASLFFEDGSTTLYVMSVAMYVFMSVAIQLTRESVKGKVEGLKKWKKRSCRVVGFLASAVMFTSFGTYIFIACGIILFVFSFLIPEFGFDEWHTKIKNKEIKNPVCFTMVTHQAHYFVYNYVLLAIVYEFFHSALIAVIWVVFNWIPYTITEPTIKKLKIKNYYLFGIGAHVLNGIVLTAMWILAGKQNIWVVALLWMITGFGGGNVYCVRKAISEVKEYDNDTWMFSENIGHILGMITCVLVVWLFNGEATMLAGALYALVTVPVMIATINKYKKEKK